MIEVDREKCIGCGYCVSVCPEVFDLDKDGKCRIKDKNSKKACAKEAAEGCPVEAIKIS